MMLNRMFENLDVEIIGPDVDVGALSLDSRDVSANSLFAALSGSGQDGHAYIDEAVSKGAVAVLSERKPSETQNVTWIRTSRPRQVLAKAADTFYGSPSKNLKLIGVTGTNGKTTTVHMISSLMRAMGLSVGTIGTLGITFDHADEYCFDGTLTTPDCLGLMQAFNEFKEHKSTHVAMEVSSHALEQERVFSLSFDVAIFVNLTRDHLDYHGTMESYLCAKKKLFSERLKPDGYAVLNIDDPNVRLLTEMMPAENIVACSLTSNVSHDTYAHCLYVEWMRHSRNGIDAEINVDGERFRLTLPVLGDFNLMNSLCALGAGLALGFELKMMLEACSSLSPIPGRLEKISADAEPLVLVDYAHTPDALRKSLNNARDVSKGALVCVFGCGGDRDMGKRAEMGRVAGDFADKIVITNDNPRGERPGSIAQAIEEGVTQSTLLDRCGEYCIELSRKKAIEKSVLEASLEDVIMIAGKGHENYQVIGEETLDFDDRSTARDALTKWRAKNVNNLARDF
jgi:UDP-N-acetylmuramoyl-L-alanyl-D-glutamate--2,6-diaminopimelate ligase